MGKFVQGFNLIELILCIAISSILSCLTIPSFIAEYQRKKTLVIVTQIEEIFRFARSNALRKNRSITICPALVNSKDIIQNCISQSRSDDWSYGAISYFNSNYDNGYHKDIRLQRFKFENHSTNLIHIKSNSLYFIDANSIISSTGHNNKFCFYFSSELIHTPQLGVLVFDRYGNSKFCNNVEYNDCIKECQ